MGLRFRRSIRLLPGVRLNLSRSGVGLSVGVPGARFTYGADGRRRTTVGLPGTGLSWVEETGSRRRPPRPEPVPPRAAAPAKPPGLFADRDRRRLHRALTERDWETAATVADVDEALALAARTVAGLGWLADAAPARARPLLAAVIADGRDPADDGFIRDYVAPAGNWSVTVSPGATASLPVSRDLVGLALAELLQADGEPAAAIDVLESLTPTTIVAASLAELYLLERRWTDLVELTEALEAVDDVTCWLLSCRGGALRALGQPGAATEALTAALRRRSLDPVVRNLALVERASAWLDLGQRAKARRDLDRVIAHDADFPGVDAVQARLGTG